MFKQNSRKFVLLASVAALVSCVSAPPVADQSSKGMFAHMQQVPINVSAINVHTMNSNVGGDFIADPAKVADEYVNARYKPQGMQDSIEVTIEQATVTKATKKSNNKVARFFEVDDAAVYDITLRVKFEQIESGGRLVYGKVFNARRTMTISEHASVGERERLEVEGLRTMFNQLDQAIYRTLMQEMRLTY